MSGVEFVSCFSAFDKDESSAQRDENDTNWERLRSSVVRPDCPILRLCEINRNRVVSRFSAAKDIKVMEDSVSAVVDFFISAQRRATCRLLFTSGAKLVMGRLKRGHNLSTAK